MAREFLPVEVGDAPELLRLAEEVRATNQPRVLRREGEDLAIVMPVASSGSRRTRRRPLPRGRPTSADDPLWNIVGIGRSEGPTDVSTNKYKYLTP
ncbi:MAG: hypothetical protein HYY04_13130 [Chloroflexi bacterium]|nr:hypothetical protein [Chloroflexota bacterium]